MSNKSVRQNGQESKPINLTAHDFCAVGVPLTLSHSLLLPYQHSANEHGAACRDWNGRRVDLRTGHVVELGLMCKQASELHGHLLDLQPLSGPGEILESLCYQAAVKMLAERVRRDRTALAFAEEDLRRTRRDTYHYEERVETCRAALEETQVLLSDLLYDSAVKAAPVTALVRVAA